GFNQKSGGSTITGYQQTGSIVASTGSNHFLSYTDGTAPATSSNISNELLSTGSFSFDVKASNTDLRRLQVFLGATGNTTGTFTAQLLNSANQVIDTKTDTVTSTISAVAPAVFRVDFEGDASTDHLLVTYSRTSGSAASDQITLAAATVSPVPEPASLS